MKLLIMILTAIAGFFQIFFPMPERTDWFQDGEYIGFFDNAEEKTMEKLMELAKAGDTESICDVFSMSARKKIEDLPGQVGELVSFLPSVTSWDADRQRYSQANNVRNRNFPYTLTTEEGTYECLIRDKIGIGGGGDHIFGFDNVSIYPEELGEEYAGLGADTPGIYIVHRASGENEAAVKAGNAMNELLSGTAEDLCARLPEDIAIEETDAAALLEFLNNAGNQEPYTWCRREEDAGWDHTVWEEAFLHLQTDSGNYRCDIRTRTDRFRTSLYSVTVFPSPNPGKVPDYEDIYRERCILGRDSPGIFLVTDGK